MKMGWQAVMALGVVLGLGVGGCGAVGARTGVVWVCSTEEAPWRVMPSPSFTVGPVGPGGPVVTAGAAPQAGAATQGGRGGRGEGGQAAEIRLVPRKTYQAMEGFGGCFNELGWMALKKLPVAERGKAIEALFGKEGCGFNLARLPIGASDFAADGYSLAATPEDYELKDFSIERDRRDLLPYVKAAMGVRPDLRCWGSPWSPPAWMKTNNSYARGSIRSEPAVYRTYANYLVKWIEAYRGEGVAIYGLSPQNEPNILNVYPTCEWTGPQLREFIGEHLGPTLRERQANVELWLGLNGDPPNGGDNANGRLMTVMEDAKASGYLTGIAFQYDSRNQIALAKELYPEKKLMQSETECNRGANSWADAQKLYGLMKRYIEGGASSYFAWNMVLDETGMSTWKWKQNALITADVKEQKIRLNGEYQVMRHFSRYIEPGAKRALMTGPWGDQMGFINPDGTAVLVIANSSRQVQAVRIEVVGRAGMMRVELPALSFSTIVIEREGAGG